MKSLSERLLEVNNRPSGFDYMRIILAVSVIVVHTFLITGGTAADQMFWTTPFGYASKAIVPMFFALSGFLVAGSFERCKTLVMFISLRVIRIYPALMVEVALSCFVLGATFTTLSLGDYFSHPVTHQYMLNALGEIHYRLPGVFEANPFPGIVNGQLWTVPFELACYLIAAVLIILGMKTRRYLIIVASIALIVLFATYRLAYLGLDPLPMKLTLPGWIAVQGFLVGFALFLYRDFIPFSLALLVITAVLSVICLTWLPGGDYIVVIPLSYVTVYLGLLNPRKHLFLKGADYSYGIYLYGFAIQQTFAQFEATRPWWIHLPLSLAAAAAFAALSWHWVEKPALKFKRFADVLEQKYLRLKSGIVKSPSQP